MEGLLATLAPCPAKKMCEVCSDLEEADDLKIETFNSKIYRIKHDSPVNIALKYGLLAARITL